MIAGSATIGRLRLDVRGVVQGVGFRPFVYRLASELQLGGWVRNSPAGVVIEVEGPAAALEHFRRRLAAERPPLAALHGVDCARRAPAGERAFSIRASRRDGRPRALVLPDLAPCADCLRDLRDPHDRHFRYPFTNCTNCGPRFSIVTGLPYDRARTTMRNFPMCPACRAEYENPLDRRFHAQPTACPVCGPRLQLTTTTGRTLRTGDPALLDAAEALRRGRIVAIKGLGGFHLAVDARNQQAVRELRARKRRPAKPLAVMTASLAGARILCQLSPLEEQLLASPAAPIVLAGRRPGDLAAGVAPRNACLGVMLPSTPLHHLLLAELGFPIVATSGNLSDEPICTDNAEALARLGTIADLLLIHDRPIARRIDDSVVRVIAGQPMMIRRARGYAPLPIDAADDGGDTLAVGGQFKNTTAVARGGRVFFSQHLGDLDAPRAFDAFEDSIATHRDLFDARVAKIACDLHPDYRSTRYAESHGAALVRVQHHYAHVLSCMSENALRGPALGVAWDGTGYGLDGTIWGGEFLRIRPDGFSRIAHLRTFRLPGGERAVREPRRSALGVLFELFGRDLPVDPGFAPPERDLLLAMLARGVQAPVTSSAGRLFDAVAALLGLCRVARFEGQAAIELESVVEPCEEAYAGAACDWEALVRAILDDIRHGVDVGRISARFHNSLAEVIVHAARAAGEERVVLTGGCFQNRYLSERAIRRLRESGFRPYWHRQVPPNDGGLALGQLVAAARE